MRARILRTIAVITALAIVGFGAPLAVAVTTGYDTQMRLVLQREASAAAVEVPNDVSAVDPDFPRAEVGTALAVYNPDGSRRHGDGPPEADAVVRRAYEADPADGVVGTDMVVAVPVLVDDQVVAVVRASTSRRQMGRRAAGALADLLALGAAVLAFALLAAWWQSQRLAEPLVRLAGAAAALGRGDLSARGERSGLVEVDAVATALDDAAEELGRQLERERAFSADVSHQLRTPLAGLRIELENALRTPEADRTRAIEHALDAIDRLSGTVEDLLLLGRDLRVGGAHADVPDALAGVAADWREPLAEQGRRLAVRTPATLPSVRFADAALRHVLDVLVANSAEHGDGTVSVTTGVASGCVAIEVADEGPGITGEPERAFARRADRHRTRGIGLALARTLAEAEGGQLRYLADPPRFRLDMPTEPATATATATAPPDRRGAGRRRPRTGFGHR